MSLIFCFVLGDDIAHSALISKDNERYHQQVKTLILFSGNDYLGSSSHPTIGKAAAKVSLKTFSF